MLGPNGDPHSHTRVVVDVHRSGTPVVPCSSESVVNPGSPSTSKSSRGYGVPVWEGPPSFTERNTSTYEGEFSPSRLGKSSESRVRTGDVSGTPFEPQKHRLVTSRGPFAELKFRRNRKRQRILLPWKRVRARTPEPTRHPVPRLTIDLGSCRTEADVS